MNIELPKKFTRYDKNGVREVYIENGILKMKNTVGFKSLMRKITYELKGMRCFYCGKIVPPSRITIDHLIPQDIGGPTITNNLVPACNRCNVEKSNMNLIQYMKYLKSVKVNIKLIKKFKIELIKKFNIVFPENAIF